MSINWVMLDATTKNFIPLPREKVLFTSANRTALALQTPNSYPGKVPLSIKCNDGRAIITNQRLIYLPNTPTTALQSFQSPLLSLNDTHVSAPFFGPNVWEGVLIPTAGGGIPAHHNLVQIKLTFKEGGAFDFSAIFEQMKETLSQAQDTARESGRIVQPGEVDLEQLPAYEETVGAVGVGARIPQSVAGPSAAAQPNLTAQGYTNEKSASTAATASAPRSTPSAAPPPSIQRPVPVNPNGTTNQRPPPQPNEPPPGYEEASSNTAAENLERQVRDL